MAESNQPYLPPESGDSPQQQSDALLQRRTFWLRAVWVGIAGVVIPPCFGLVGTVVGMTGAFSTLSESGEADPEELAGDISVALLTTVYGLAVSAFFLIFLVVACVKFFRLPRPIATS